MYIFVIYKSNQEREFVITNIFLGSSVPVISAEIGLNWLNIYTEAFTKSRDSLS